MSDQSKLGPWIRRFLLEHMVADRNLSRNTQRSYRDTLALLLPFATKELKTPVNRLLVDQVSIGVVRSFLQYPEEARGCCIATRNQRLAAIHALACFIGEHSPEHVEWCGQLRSVPFKKAARPHISFLDKPEIDALLACPDRHTAQGRRDHALLLFLYNSGARADEAAQLTIGRIDVHSSSVSILGKGRKQRLCLLWPDTLHEQNDCEIA